MADPKAENHSLALGLDHDRRPLPSNLTAEQIVIGGLLMHDDSYDVVSELLTSTHFFDPLHARLYKSIEELLIKGQKATPVTLMPFFENVSPSNGQTMRQYLAGLAAAGAPPRLIKPYAQTVYDLALRRQLIQTGKDLTATAYDMPVETTPLAMIEETEQALYAIADKKHDTAAIPFVNTIQGVARAATQAFKTGGKGSGLSVGLLDLDNRLGGGFYPGQLIVIAGRPGMGKSALAVNIGYCAARRTRAADGRRGIPVALFSLEMRNDEIGRRLLAQESGVKANCIKAGDFSVVEHRSIQEAADRIESTPFYIDHTGGISVPELMMRARRMKRQYGIGLLVVDYLQLITTIRERNGNRTQEIGEISGALKQLAMELDISVVALSQLSRDVEKREDKRPNLADLRDGGTIEQDADVVMFVYREEYYWLKANPYPSQVFMQANWHTEHVEKGRKGLAEIIIAKQRDGPTATVVAQFDGHFTRFSDLKREQ